MILMCFQHILSSPDEIMTMNGQKLPLKCSVDYISFSAHTDYQQTSEFIRALKPAQIVSIPSQICQHFIINMSLRHPCHINMVSFFRVSKKTDIRCWLLCCAPVKLYCDQPATNRSVLLDFLKIFRQSAVT